MEAGKNSSSKLGSQSREREIGGVNVRGVYKNRGLGRKAGRDATGRARKGMSGCMGHRTRVGRRNLGCGRGAGGALPAGRGTSEVPWQRPRQSRAREWRRRRLDTECLRGSPK
ncbi:hypothetical protein CRG98_029157 [Punica granatum]|uniref:Uncharacterized protein n=1 Tax=Punica granatum TaxID=22663 RepID=A0A2I0J2E3_PUNGR|nr:hypothetical protein CRG98_029157 [Punica granatum]